MSVVGVVVVIAAAVPIMLVGLIPMLAMCYYFSERYLQVGDEIDGVVRR